MSDPADHNLLLRQLMQIELEKCRADLARIAAGAKETEAELQAVALRLTGREAELETVRAEASSMTAELSWQVAENTKLTKLVQSLPKQQPPNLATRAVRKVRRLGGKAVRSVRK